MNKHVISALFEVVLLFGTPLALIAGGWILRRRFREREPRLAFHAGTFLVGAGGLTLLSVFALIAMMRHW